jgi:hypothetical protein
VADDLRGLSDIELYSLIHDLELQVVTLQPHIEDPKIWRRRSFKILLATLITGGGFFGASIDLMALVFVPLGFIVWIEEIVDDARSSNQDLSIRKSLITLQGQLADAEAELDRRAQ